MCVCTLYVYVYTRIMFFRTTTRARAPAHSTARRRRRRRGESFRLSRGATSIHFALFARDPPVDEAEKNKPGRREKKPPEKKKKTVGPVLTRNHRAHSVRHEVFVRKINKVKISSTENGRFCSTTYDATRKK